MKNEKFKELAEKLENFLKVLWWILTHFRKTCEWASLEREGYPRGVKFWFVRHNFYPDGDDMQSLQGGMCYWSWREALKANMSQKVERFRISVSVSQNYPNSIRGLGSALCSGVFYPAGKLRSFEELKAVNQDQLSEKKREGLRHCLFLMRLAEERDEPMPRVVETRHGGFFIMAHEDQII